MRLRILMCHFLSLFRKLSKYLNFLDTCAKLSVHCDSFPIAAKNKAESEYNKYKEIWLIQDA